MVVRKKYFIKKFSDRKLYDCQQSRVINFSQVVDLILEDLPIAVINHLDKDITCLVLADCYSHLLKSEHTDLSMNQLARLKRTMLIAIKELKKYGH